MSEQERGVNEFRVFGTFVWMLYTAMALTFIGYRLREIHALMEAAQ